MCGTPGAAQVGGVAVIGMMMFFPDNVLSDDTPKIPWALMGSIVYVSGLGIRIWLRGVDFVEFESDVGFVLIAPPATFFIASALARRLKRSAQQALERSEQANAALEKVNAELDASRSAALASLELAREASQAKDRFLTTISHELRTPLTTIIGYADLIVEESGADPDYGIEEGLEDVELIRRSAGELLMLVDNVLDIQRIEAGSLELDLTPTRVGELLVHTFATLERSAGPQTRCVLDNTLEDVTAVTNRVAVLKILHNLTHNANKFTRSGTITLRGTFDATHVTLEVEDTGVGIAADKLETIFDRFAQADTSSTRSFDGAGLGLAASQELAQMLGRS